MNWKWLSAVSAILRDFNDRHAMKLLGGLSEEHDGQRRLFQARLALEEVLLQLTDSSSDEHVCLNDPLTVTFSYSAESFRISAGEADIERDFT